MTIEERRQAARDLITPKSSPSIDLAIERILELEDQVAELSTSLRDERRHFHQTLEHNLRRQAEELRVREVLNERTMELYQIVRAHSTAYGQQVIVR